MMEQTGVEMDLNIPIAQFVKQIKQANKKVRDNTVKMTVDNESSPMESVILGEITTSVFSDSAEDHLTYMNAISVLFGDLDMPGFDPAEVERVSSSITFVRDWMHLNCPSRAIRFACENESKVEKDVTHETILPSLSSALVLKKCIGNGEAVSSAPSEDFVLHAGGSIWALDWCPRVESCSHVNILREFIAVSAHPPDSSFHKLGETLEGRGAVQIWCLLHTIVKEGGPSLVTSKKKETRGRPRKHPLNKSAVTEVSKKKETRGRPRKLPLIESAVTEVSKKPRGRPRKNPLVSQSAETLDVQCLGEPSAPLSLGVASANQHERVPGEGIECHSKVSANKSLSGGSKVRGSSHKSRKKAEVPESDMPSCRVDASMEFTLNPQTSRRFTRTGVCEGTAVGQAAEGIMRQPSPDSLAGNGSAADNNFPSNRLTKGSIPKDVSLPRMVLCLSHNGKVAWDVKWRPCAIYDQQRLGYLAVLLGNGALEVWEVPLPRTVQAIYSSSQEDGTDPRFLKLGPVFRCSGIKVGGRYSIPLTLEWSTSSPHDMILAGCHDGTVALWKFCASGSSADTKPLLCFSADTVPIRAICWAPMESVAESANVIVTAGHKGLKFWDLRDPFRPLWDFPVQRIIYGLDWSPDPRCIVMSVDDGTLRILSLANAANDLPVTGSRFTGTPQQGLYSYMCSRFPIWGIHVSTLTGMVAYCGADGTALRFQLTAKAVGKDPHRNRAPHFLCGSVMEEDSFLRILTPLHDSPFPMMKSLNEFSDTPRSKRGFLHKSGQDKRAKLNNVDALESNNLLALCYRDEVGTELGCDDTMVGESSKHVSKLKIKGGKKKKNDEPGIGIACVDDENTKMEERESGQKEKITFPPKIVAMHRIRWNRNKGGENWLCYGGAAGILRCQAIWIRSFPDRSEGGKVYKTTTHPEKE